MRAGFAKNTTRTLPDAPAEGASRPQVAWRTTNDYGKSSEDRDLILAHLREVEPLLRTTCTHEIDATQPLADVVEQLLEIARGS